MATRDVWFEVDDEAVQRKLKETDNDFDGLINLIAIDAARALESEGGKHSSRLGSGWQIEGVGPFERHITPPEDAWWAHFIAGGTSAHGPADAPYLVFSVDGDTIFTEHVEGIGATHFDEAAMSVTRRHLDDILRRAIGG